MSSSGVTSDTKNSARIGAAGQSWDLDEILKQAQEDGTVLKAGEGACKVEERSWVEVLVDQLLEEGGDECEHLCNEMVQALVNCQDEEYSLETKLAWLRGDLRQAIRSLGDAAGPGFNPHFWWASMEVGEVDAGFNVLRSVGVSCEVLEAFEEFRRTHREVAWRRDRLHNVRSWMVSLAPGHLEKRGVSYGWIREYRKRLLKWGASFQTQDDIFEDVVGELPVGCVHVSGGLADANGLSDVDILLPREISEGEVGYLPEGSWEKESKPGRRLFGIPGYDREVNLYVSADPAARQSIRHRETMLELEREYPQLREKARQYKALGRSSESAWALVLDLPGDPYQAMEDTEKVLTIARVHARVGGKLAAKEAVE